jgi:hypothetical protein
MCDHQETGKDKDVETHYQVPIPDREKRNSQVDGKTELLWNKIGFG